MSNFADKIASNTKDVTDDVKAFGHDVLKLAGSVGAEAKSRLDNIGDAARDQTQAAYSNVKAQVSGNPAMALGVAVGVGVLVGFMLKGRH
jgi:ElaB/YqjD/DUF883 family membrane-anchored ribosome-binding protein